MSEPTNEEIKQKIAETEDDLTNEEIDEKSVSELLYPEGALTPADDGWSFDPESDEVLINPVYGFTRRVDADTFFEVNSGLTDPR